MWVFAREMFSVTEFYGVLSSRAVADSLMLAVFRLVSSRFAAQASLCDCNAMYHFLGISLGSRVNIGLGRGAHLFEIEKRSFLTVLDRDGTFMTCVLDDYKRYKRILDKVRLSAHFGN